jgi:hypothetical protein
LQIRTGIWPIKASTSWRPRGNLLPGFFVDHLTPGSNTFAPPLGGIPPPNPPPTLFCGLPPPRHPCWGAAATQKPRKTNINSGQRPATLGGGNHNKWSPLDTPKTLFKKAGDRTHTVTGTHGPVKNVIVHELWWGQAGQGVLVPVRVRWCRNSWKLARHLPSMSRSPSPTPERCRCGEPVPLSSNIQAYPKIEAGRF